mgnify:CR=1 FL=1
MIYLNNAATTYPKLPCVLEAHAAALANPPQGQFRGTSSGSIDFYGDCQADMSRILGVKDRKRIFFTSGATHSLNALLSGLDLHGKRIVATATEHNSVLRPLYNLPQLKGSEIVIVPCDRFGKVRSQDVENCMTANTGLVIVNHCSNVTGMVQDMKDIGQVAGEYGALFLADVSQSAGCLPIHGDQWRADALVFTGHKGLFGVQGTGGFYISRKQSLRPFLFGGTGRDSSRLIYQTEAEYEYDAGTQNAPGLIALKSGVDAILEKGVETIQDREQKMVRFLYDGLEQLSGVTVYGQKNVNTGPVVSFNVQGLFPADTAYILQNGYGIVVRAGLHCAPLIHSFIGSRESQGTVRVSLSALNTMQDLECLLNALKEITQQCLTKKVER